MAGRPAARRPARGGGEIPAIGPARARLILAGAALLGAVGLALYGALTADRAGIALGLAGAAGVVVLGAALGLRRTVLIGPALLLLGVEYGARFAVGPDAIDVRSPVYGACFLAVAELAYASLELRAGRPEPGLTSRRILVLTGLALASIVLGTVVLAAASTPFDGGLGLSAAGIAAAVALLIGIGRLAARSR